MVDPSESVAGAMTTVDIATPGPYRVTGVQRSRRAPGLVLGAAGIVLSAVGAGMAIGGGAFRSGLTSSEETWFWAGLLTMGAGVTLTPLGFKMYSRSPRVEALEPGAPLPPASSFGELPKRYREPVLADGQAPSAGNTVVDEPRWGLLSAGAITFAASYGIMAGIAAGYAADGDEPKRYTTLLIPFIGPTIVDRRDRGDGGGWTLFGTIPQVVGGVLMVCGLGTSRRVGVANDTGLVVTPLAAPGLAGMSLSRAF